MGRTITCGCYRQVQTKQRLSDFQKGVLFAKTGKYKESLDVIEGRCFGTREMEICKCGGDRSKCDFYPI